MNRNKILPAALSVLGLLIATTAQAAATRSAQALPGSKVAAAGSSGSAKSNDEDDEDGDVKRGGVLHSGPNYLWIGLGTVAVAGGASAALGGSGSSDQKGGTPGQQNGGNDSPGG